MIAKKQVSNKFKVWLIDTKVYCRTEEKNQWIHEEKSTIGYIILKFLELQVETDISKSSREQKQYLERQNFSHWGIRIMMLNART